MKHFLTKQQLINRLENKQVTRLVIDNNFDTVNSIFKNIIGNPITKRDTRYITNADTSDKISCSMWGGSMNTFLFYLKESCIQL